MEVKCGLHIFTVTCYIFTDQVKAVKDIWLVCHNFLKDIYYVLQDLKIPDRSDARKKTKIPYMYEFYNIINPSFTQQSYTRNVFALILNAVIQGVNELSFLPHFIIFIIDSDILWFINFFSFGISIMLGKCLTWLVTTVECVIEGKKDEMRQRRPGSVTYAEPKFIWVKMINRVNGTSQVLAAHNKFNNILEDILAARKHHYIIDISKIMTLHSFFTPNNFINDDSRHKFWRELDKCI